MDATPEVQLQAVEAELRQLEQEIESLLTRQQVLQAQRDQLCRFVSANARAPKADWQGSFAWDESINTLLQTHFGLQAFRCKTRGVFTAWARFQPGSPCTTDTVICC